MTNGQQVTLTKTLRMGANFTVRKGTVGTVIEAGAHKHLVQFPNGQIYTANVEALGYTPEDRIAGRERRGIPQTTPNGFTIPRPPSA